MGTLGGIFGESGSGHRVEQLSCTTVQGDPRYETGGGGGVHRQHYLM